MNVRAGQMLPCGPSDLTSETERGSSQTIGSRRGSVKRNPTLPPIRPSAPIRAKYEARLLALVDEMNASVTREVVAAYRRNTPEVVLYAADDSPARSLRAIMRKLGRRWLARFDAVGPRLAAHFATAVKDRCERTLAANLREAGISVRFKMTPAMNDAYQAVIGENVALIRSIGQDHLAQVEGLVMRSVQEGRDLATLAKGLEQRHGITRRRAAGIALDQNNKATAVMRRTRELSVGITDGEWLHSAGGKVPRPDHVAFSGKRFNLRTGHDFHNGEGTVWPGTAIKCRCTWKAVVPGFDG